MTNSRPAPMLSPDRIPLLLLVLALVTYPLFWSDAPRMTGDGYTYQAVAQDLRDGVMDDLHVRSPGYPLVLLLTGSAESPNRVLFLVALLAYLGSAYLVVDLLRYSQTGTAPRLLCAGLLVLPPFVEPSAHVATEGVATFFLVLTVWLLFRIRSNTWSGVLTGLSVGACALIRPSYLLLGLVLGLVLTILRERRRAVGLVLASSILTGAWCVHNWTRFDYFGISPMLGVALSFRTAPFVDRLPEGPVKSILIEERDHALLHGEGHTGAGYIYDAMPRLTEATGLRGADLDGLLVRVNLSLIARAPLQYLAGVGAGIWTYWFPAVGPLSYGESRGMQGLWIVVHFGVVGLFWLQLASIAGTLSTHGLRQSTGTWGPLYIVAAVIVFYTMLLSCLLTEGAPRYRSPTDGLIVLITVLGLSAWKRERSR